MQRSGVLQSHGFLQKLGAVSDGAVSDGAALFVFGVCLCVRRPVGCPAAWLLLIWFV